jgi:hypothetical protein
MSRKTIGKAAVAMGGLVIVVGMIMLGTSAIAFFDIFNPDLFLNEEPQVIFVWVLLILGVIDLISGIILWLGD